eukprot:1157565-Pelagomonas_calceolata.AAC.15
MGTFLNARGFFGWGSLFSPFHVQDVVQDEQHANLKCHIPRSALLGENAPPYSQVLFFLSLAALPRQLPVSPIHSV